MLKCPEGNNDRISPLSVVVPRVTQRQYSITPCCCARNDRDSLPSPHFVVPVENIDSLPYLNFFVPGGTQRQSSIPQRWCVQRKTKTAFHPYMWLCQEGHKTSLSLGILFCQEGHKYVHIFVPWDTQRQSSISSRCYDRRDTEIVFYPFMLLCQEGHKDSLPSLHVIVPWRTQGQSFIPPCWCAWEETQSQTSITQWCCVRGTQKKSSIPTFCCAPRETNNILPSLHFLFARRDIKTVF